MTLLVNLNPTAAGTDPGLAARVEALETGQSGLWNQTNQHDLDIDRLRDRVETIELSGVEGLPIGTLVLGLWTTPPANCLFLIGQELQRGFYPELWDWANAWENPNGNTWQELFGLTDASLVLPASEQDFIRIARITAFSGDGGLPVGEWQGSQNLSHAHNYLRQSFYYTIPAGSTYGAYLIQGSNTTGASGGSEARPRSRAFNAALKVR
ncbi:hypothetical protein HC928_11270 [bacterium]|nr:hypothetical protein [bacterium]